jgi:hypothetical protein
MVNTVISADARLRKAAGGNDAPSDGQRKPIAGPGHPGVGTLSPDQQAAYRQNTARKNASDAAVRSADSDAKRAADAATNARMVNARSPYQPKYG